MSVKIDIGRVSPLTDPLSGGFDALLDFILAHLTGTTETEYFIGQVGGAEPTSDIGIWVNNNVFYQWNPDINKYVPIPLVGGGLPSTSPTQVLTTFLQSQASSGNVTLFLPDENNQFLATLRNIERVHLPLSTYSGTQYFLTTVNGTNRFYGTLNSNGTVTIDRNIQEGQKVYFYAEQPPSSSFTLTFDPIIHWFLGTPTMSTSGAGVRTVDYYEIERVGDLFFGFYIQGFATAVSGGDNIAPVVTSLNGSNGVITLSASELLKSATPAVSTFVVKKNNNTQVINSVSVNGSVITIDLANTFTHADSVQVQYLGGANVIEDLAGNDMAAFPLRAVTIPSSTGSGSGAGNGTGASPDSGGTTGTAAHGTFLRP